jgi:hypothetical protein
MDFLGGALPNVMFIVGMLAIGLGLGIELKLVPLNKEIDKNGRIGAMVVGAVLVASSLYVYLNPSLINRNQPSSTSANAAVLSAAAPTAAPAATNAPAAVNAAPTAIPTATSAPTPVPTAVPTATSVPTATPVPTAVPTATSVPTATPVPTAVPPTKVPSVVVPDLRGKSDRDAQRMLQDAGLSAKKADRCSGSNEDDQKVKKGQVLCQNPAANQRVAPGTTVEYVLAGK